MRVVCRVHRREDLTDSAVHLSEIPRPRSPGRVADRRGDLTPLGSEHVEFGGAFECSLAVGDPEFGVHRFDVGSASPPTDRTTPDHSSTRSSSEVSSATNANCRGSFWFHWASNVDLPKPGGAASNTSLAVVSVSRSVSRAVPPSLRAPSVPGTSSENHAHRPGDRVWRRVLRAGRTFAGRGPGIRRGLRCGTGLRRRVTSHHASPRAYSSRLTHRAGNQTNVRDVIGRVGGPQGHRRSR